MTATAENPATAVLHVGGLHYASEKAVVESVLSRRPGVIAVDANPVAQTASVVLIGIALCWRGARVKAHLSTLEDELLPRTRGRAVLRTTRGYPRWR